MTVSAPDLAEMRQLRETMPEIDDVGDLSALLTTEEVIGFTIASARHDGEDEVHMVELLIRLTEMSPDDVRRSERILRPTRLHRGRRHDATHRRSTEAHPRAAGVRPGDNRHRQHSVHTLGGNLTIILTSLDNR
jgi:hypothetical protein